MFQVKGLENRIVKAAILLFVRGPQYYPQVCLFVCLFVYKILFVHLREREHELGGGAEEEADSPLSRELILGLDHDLN